MNAKESCESGIRSEQANQNPDHTKIQAYTMEINGIDDLLSDHNNISVPGGLTLPKRLTAQIGVGVAGAAITTALEALVAAPGAGLYYTYNKKS